MKTEEIRDFSGMTKNVDARPLNCAQGIHTSSAKHPRCPACGLWHIRAGYCAALDDGSEFHEMLRDGRWVGAEYITGSVTLRENPVTLTSENVTLSPDVTLTSEPVTLSVCETCGGDFAPKRSTARYCSDVCRQKAHRT